MKVPRMTPTHFCCILLDKKDSAIQANADLRDKERFDNDLQMNMIYKIQGFGYEKTDKWQKTLDNDITLSFGTYTKIDPIPDTDFPYHYFNFAAYNKVGGRVENKDSILTDYIWDMFMA